ncbi:hypothetical protein C2S52_016095 [Perilla frutescens var. hirtella]|nr:hypothetical protein C2S52_016095 [Perilla frutescens var. hirtella]
MRRRFKSNTEFPLTKTTGDIARNRGFQKPSEMRKAKRVRFDDAETDASSRGHEATQSPGCGAPKTSEFAYFRKVKDASVKGQFRALHKENEQLKSSKISYLLRETDKACEKLDPSMKDLDFSNAGESTGPSGHKFSISPPVTNCDESYEIRKKELIHQTKKRPPLLTETVTPVGESLFSSLPNQATKQSENQCSEKGIFSEKRERLRQWVAHTTSSEVEKRHEKGSDLVSFLLCRLIPKGNENNESSKGDADNSSKFLTLHESNNLEKGLPLSHKRDCLKDLPKNCSERSGEIVLGERDIFYSEFPSNYRTESDLQNETIDRSGRSREIVLRELDGFCSRFPSNYRKESDLQNEAMDHSGRSSDIVLREWDGFGSGFPSNYRKESDLQNEAMDHSGRSSDIVLREWDGFGSGFPSNYGKENNLQNETVDPGQHSNSRICNSSDTEHGFSFCLPFESFRSLGVFRLKDLDEFGPITGHRREEAYRHSLEWDFEFGKDRVDHGSRKDVCHRLANDWNVDQQRIMDNMLDTKGFGHSPLFSSHYLFNSLPNYASAGCLMQEVAPNFNDVNYAMAEPGHFSLALPSSPRHIPLAEDKNAENLICNSNLVLSYRDPRWPKKKIWDCMPQTDYWWQCLSAPEFSAEDHPSGFHAYQFPQNENGSYSLSLLKESPEKPFTSLYEGAFDPYLYSSTLHSPLDRFRNCRMLLNHVSQNILDQELYFDDYDNDLGYRKML